MDESILAEAAETLLNDNLDPVKRRKRKPNMGMGENNWDLDGTDTSPDVNEEDSAVSLVKVF